MRIVTLIAGAAGSGKDTAGKILVEEYGFRRIAFADPLKDGLAIMLGLPRELFYDKDAKERPCPPPWQDWTPRRLAQFVGTELFRNQFDEAVWAKTAASIILSNAVVEKWVITDARFPNEIGLKHFLNSEYEVVPVKVIRPGIVKPASGITGHESERGVNVNKIIVNDGTLEDLHTRVVEFARMLGLERA